MISCGSNKRNVADRNHSIVHSFRLSSKLTNVKRNSRNRTRGTFLHTYIDEPSSRRNKSQATPGSKGNNRETSWQENAC